MDSWSTYLFESKEILASFPDSSFLEKKKQKNKIIVSVNLRVQEAKQALELMHKWETIDVCDALELLSPVFESEEVVSLIKIKLNIFILYSCNHCYSVLSHVCG